MCDKCKNHKIYWLHIADNWTLEEKEEMILHLLNNKDMLSEYQKEIRKLGCKLDVENFVKVE